MYVLCMYIYNYKYKIHLQNTQGRKGRFFFFKKKKGKPILQANMALSLALLHVLSHHQLSRRNPPLLKIRQPFSRFFELAVTKPAKHTLCATTHIVAGTAATSAAGAPG